MKQRGITWEKAANLTEYDRIINTREYYLSQQLAVDRYNKLRTSRITSAVWREVSPQSTIWWIVGYDITDYMVYQ